MSLRSAGVCFAMLLLGSFAVIALILAVGGVYAMVAYAVNQRTHELAVRVALGARPIEVVRTVMARGLGALAIAPVRAQDVPGIEICTVEKTMERRTSCLQSNVDFLQKTITKLTLDHQQKLDAANRQIDALKTLVAGLQKTLGDLQAAQVKIADDLKKKQDAPPPKDAAK